MPILLSNIGQVEGATAQRQAPFSRIKTTVRILPDGVTRLVANEVHVWALTGEPEEVAECASLLSPAEMERARRFRFPALFERFVADHARLRLLLATYLEFEPQSLEFVENAQGKPRLDLPDCRLRFNMSHTRGLTVIAVCLDAEIGIDVEALRSVEDRDDIASLHFSPLESEALRAQPAEERDAAFLRCWTRKEAYIKARGQGLSLPLDKFAVNLDGKNRAALVQCDWDNQEPSRWMLEHLQPAPGFIGALAIEQGTWSVLHFAWPTGSTSHHVHGERV
jgi:4'-phosphopantetheinyl transferase